MVFREMSTTRKGTATRSQGRGRTPAQGPQAADPHSQHIKVNTYSPRSPSRGRRLPTRNQNRQPASRVSTIASSQVKNSNPESSINPAINTINIAENSATGVHISTEINQINDKELPTSALAPSNKMGDNKDIEHTTGISIEKAPTDTSPTPPAPPPEAWQQTLEELKAIGQQVSKLDKIEKTTDRLSQQMESLVHRTASLEDFAQQASTRFSNLESKISTIDNTVLKTNDLEDRLQNLKKDIQQENDKRINDLQQEIQAHKTQIDTLKKQSENFKKEAESKQELLESFRKQTEALKKDADSQKVQVENLKKSEGIKRKAEVSIEQLRQDVDYQKLKDQALRNRRNLVIIGQPEQLHLSPYAEARQFLKSQFNISKMELDIAYRLGTAPQEGSDYARPLVMAFSRLSDRNQIWRKRKDIKQTQGAREIHIQADIPKQLREDLQVLYRVAKAASAIPKYKSASIKDYKLHLDGNQYAASDLEKLPLPLRPSSLAAPRSDNTMVFFSKFCVLSNHYPSEFTLQDTTFYNVEHYLAFKRATLSRDEDTIQKALHAKQPIQAKVILNSLRDDHKQEWKQMVPEIALQGVRAKFETNKELADYLCDTEPLLLGEASKDKIWGIGFSLEDKEALDNSKWQQNGNLLGRTLMKVRGELLEKRNTLH